MNRVTVGVAVRPDWRGMTASGNWQSAAHVPPSSPGWLHEIEHDGYRFMASLPLQHLEHLPPR